jgi:ribose 5-phosphate isomerase B
MDKILMGADPWGFELKNSVKEHLEKKGYEVVDIGMHDEKKEMDYYVVGETAAKKIQDGEVERGILFCGTGMGVSIVANKFKGISASVVESEFAAKMCKAANNSNILTMGGMILSTYKAKLIADIWLETKPTEGLEPKMADFLTASLKEIKKIEDKVFK